MSDLILMLLSALGAVAGAAAILATLGIGAAVLTSAAGGAASLAVAAIPGAACLGGVAFAASKTGYGGG